MASTKMALLYNSRFSDISPDGICKLHKTLFGDAYDWAGQYRIINIQKKEEILAGKSVWYSNWDKTDKDLRTVRKKISAVKWSNLTREEFAHSVAHLFLLYGRLTHSEKATQEQPYCLLHCLLKAMAITLIMSYG